MKRTVPSLLALAVIAAAGAAAPSAPARAASMDPFLEQQQTEQALNRAILLYGEGDYEEAEKVARAYLRFDPSSAKAYEVLGAVLGRLGKVDEALEALDNAIKLDPKQATAYVNRAVLLMSQDHVDEARAALETAVEIAPGMRAARERLGRVYEADGRYDDAVEQYEKAIADAPEAKDPGVRVNLANLYNARGDFDKAYALLSPWSRDRSLDSSVQRVLGDALLGQERYDAAVRQFRFALDVDPENRANELGLGVALRASGGDRQAMDLFRKLAGEMPESPLPVVQIAETQLAMGDADAAKETFRKAIAMAEDPTGIEQRYAAVLVQTDDAAGAAKVLEGVIDREGAEPRRLAALAAAYAAADQPDKELETLERATTAFPDDEGGFVRLAMHWRDSGDAAKALEVAQAGLERHPDSLVLLRVAATTSRDEGKLEQAVKYGERLLHLAPDSVPDKFIYATLLDRAQMDGPAAQFYREVADKQPDNWAAMNNLALVLSRLGRDQEALTYARLASQLQPDNPAVTHTLAYVLFQVGSLGESERLMEKAATALPDVAEIRYDYGAVLLARGRKEQARKQLEKALELDPDNPKAAKARDSLLKM